MGWLISKIIGLALIAAGIALEIVWVTFLFGSVLMQLSDAELK